MDLLFQVFDEACVTLSGAFLEYVCLMKDASYLEWTASDFGLKFEKSDSSSKYSGSLSALSRLERYFNNQVFGGDVMPPNTTSIHTQTDEGMGASGAFRGAGDAPIQVEHKSVMCNIHQPIFSRSGRQVKIKPELYDSDQDFNESDLYSESPKAKPPKARAENAATGTSRKRGRPRKKPKMIHVDVDSKKVSEVVPGKSDSMGQDTDKQTSQDNTENGAEQIATQNSNQINNEASVAGENTGEQALISGMEDNENGQENSNTGMSLL